jgi:hypothetical protein
MVNINGEPHSNQKIDMNGGPPSS